MTDLFGGLKSYRTADGRDIEAKPRGKHYIEPRGYAAPPGTGPEGETCGSCEHLARFRRFPKCALNHGAWTHTRRTDVLVRAVACQRWERAKE